MVQRLSGSEKAVSNASETPLAPVLARHTVTLYSVLNRSTVDGDA
jgi:hypothetical protein